jgi:hypothetical protein
MINNHNVVHWINFFLPIEPNPMVPIIPRFADLDECAINELNATLEFHPNCAQHNSLLCYGPLNLISNCIINAKCNEDGIITNYILNDQYHTNASYMETLSCFIYKMNCRMHFFGVNFEGHPIQIWWSFVNPNS